MNVNPSEKVFYQSANILVTNSRFVANGTTFAMNNITSVRLHVKPKNAGIVLASILLGYGLFQILESPNSFLIPLALILTALLYYFTTKPSYSVKITTNAGEQEGFSSIDSKIAQQAVDAINEAMIHRG